MSGPNTDYDPVEVTPLQAEEVAAARDAALAAIAAAADLAALKEVRIAHAGDRSPLALANREIGALPPQARKEAGSAGRTGPRRRQPGAGRAPGGARGRARGADAGRGDRRRDAPDRPATGRVATPGHHRVRAHRRHLRGDGLGGRRGPRARGRVAQLRRAQPRARPPGPHHAGHLLDRARRPRAGAAHPHLAGAGAHHAHPHPADLRRVPGPRLPHRRVRRDPQPRLPPGRGARRRRGHHHGPPQGHARPLRDRDVRRGDHHALPPVVLPVHRAAAPRSTWSASSAAGVDSPTGSVPHLPRRGLDRVGRLRRGQPAGAGRLRRRHRALHRLRLRHGHRPHADVPPRRGGPPRALRGGRPVLQLPSERSSDPCAHPCPGSASSSTCPATSRPSSWPTGSPTSASSSRRSTAPAPRSPARSSSAAC